MSTVSSQWSVFDETGQSTIIESDSESRPSSPSSNESVVTRKPATNQADSQQQSPTGSAISISEEPEDDIDNDSEDEINFKYRSIWSLKEMAGVFDITPTVKTVMEV